MRAFQFATRKKAVSTETLRKRIYRSKKKEDLHQKKLNSIRMAVFRAKMSEDQRQAYNNKKHQYMRQRRANLSHAEKEGSKQDPMAHVNKANRPYKGCKISPQDLAGILDCK